MAIPVCTLKAYEKDRVDLAIEEFAKIEKPTQTDLSRVKIQAKIQAGIDRYRFGALSMDAPKLESEQHNSRRLARHMASCTDPRPSSHCDCHAMVSGRHEDAAPMRALMAWCLMRIDDSRNGCWLPRNYEARAHMPKWLQGAVPHQGLHNPRYYVWLTARINFDLIETSDDLVAALKVVRAMLQGGALPPAAWPKKKVI